MAYTTSPTEQRHIALDVAARALVSRVHPHVQANYRAPKRRPYIGKSPPEEVVDEAYVLTGAVRVGLNRWTLPGSQIPKPELFIPKSGTEVVVMNVDLVEDDAYRADRLSDHLGVLVEHILSAAAATGLAMLVGDHQIHGPFEVT